MIYLASPYSHPDPKVKEQRWNAVCKVASDMMQDGQMVFSPIAHTHPIALYGLPGEWQFWNKYDTWFIEKCDKICVLMLEGWQESVGVTAEIKIAESLGKPIEYIQL